ncbi:thiaminase II [Dinoroseobacter sp. PD6]|uniref:thiaminase II n=1 Tax=Dinoroseobacter sp. PD6 TaxID=3028384 RepID=UPI00237B551D|nr:thiaminase II [Dinoroseobacter sp. PD6]MDD9718391.1 thiaminase II [Dinoroseobacter sp. PD6]
MSSSGTGYGTAFTAWRAAAPDWDAYTRHAFVEGLRDGTLPRAAFLHYLAQDYVFLKHFSRAWALAIVKADTLPEMEAATATVHGLLHYEMGLHVKICAEAGIDAETLAATPEHPGNMAYTRYVLEAGYSGDFLDLLAALAPCVLGYGEIGARLAAEATSDTYGDWIGTYAGDDYQGICRDVGALIDGALTHRLGPDYATLPRFAMLSARFAQATTLEVGFWDMGLSPSSAPA